MSTADSDEESLRLLAAAKGGDADALARLIERCRGILNAQAGRELDSRLRVRAAASDVFQRTSLSAVNQFEAFQGTTMAEFTAWLKRIQRNNLLDVARDHKTAGIRSLDKEQALDGPENDAPPIADRRIPTPSSIVQTDETMAGIRSAIEQLPDDQRVVVQLRLLDELPIRDIAIQLERTEDAVAGLFKRGLAGLRRNMEPGRLARE